MNRKLFKKLVSSIENDYFDEWKYDKFCNYISKDNNLYVYFNVNNFKVKNIFKISIYPKVSLTLFQRIKLKKVITNKIKSNLDNSRKRFEEYINKL